jgi:CubicO group peptidase (beta-lactamase class C family)
MKTWIVRVLTLFTAFALLIVPVAAQDTVPLEPFTDENFGIIGLHPADWQALGPGTRSPDGGVTVLAQQAAPGASAEQVLQSLLPALLLDTAPEPLEAYESDSLLWDVYFVEVNTGSETIPVDMALAEQNGTTYLILFQTTPDAYEALHRDVFEVALAAFAPMPPEAGNGDAAQPTAVPLLDPVVEPTTRTTATVYEDPNGLYTVPIPTNWTLEEGDGYVRLAAPAGDFIYTFVTLETDRLTESAAEAWEIAGVPEDADLAYDEDDVQKFDDPAILNQMGVDDAVQIIYEDGTGENERLVMVFAQRYEGIGYYWLIEGTVTAIQQRQSQGAIIETGFQITAIEQDDLSDAEAGDITPELIAELERFIAQAMDEWETPGVSVAIVDGDEILYSNGFGVLELGQDAPVTADTMMMIGSTTKPMTTTVMGMLVDDGLLDWDAPVRDVLPEFNVRSDELSESITIANLTCACTGVPRRDLELIFNSNDLTAEDVIDSLATFDFFTEFGEAFQYSNQLVATAGYVAAAANGGEYGSLYQAYEDLMQTRLFDPLGMERTVISLDEIADYDNVSASHGIEITGDTVVNPLELERFAEPIASAGAIWSTVTDMSQYLMLMLNEGQAQDGAQLVSAANLERTWEPGISISSDVSYGLGWIIEDWKGVRVISHGGNTLGFTSELAFVPSADLGIVILSNQQASVTPMAVRTRFLELVYGLEDSDILFPSQTDQTQVEQNEQEFLDSLVMEASEDAIAQFPGTYSNPVLGEVIITINDDGELIADAGEFQSPIWLTTDEDAEANTYVMTLPPFAGQRFVFEEAEDGAITMTIGMGVLEYVFTRQ